MKLKNVLIVTKDIERSKKFYKDLFGLEVVLDNDGNVILTEGLVLQDKKIWQSFINKDVIFKNNSCELYFEENNIEEFIKKLDDYEYPVIYVNRLIQHTWGQKIIRFYDPDGNLIEVGTPIGHDRVFELAKQEEKEQIMDLYRKAIGSTGCTWSLDYPNEAIFDSDILRKALFCLKEETGEIIGAISIDDDKVVDELPYWTNDWQPGAELARLVVREDYQGCGIAGILIQSIMEELILRGYRSVHYLVSKNHERAVRAYAALDFTLMGETDLFGEHFLCYEKRL